MENHQNNGASRSSANGNEQEAGNLDHPESVSSRKESKARAFIRRFVRPVVKFGLYVLFLLLAVTLLLLGVEKAAKMALKDTYLSEVYPRDFEMVKKDFNRPVSHYDYDFNPGVCVEYNTSKGNRYEYANNAGFRSPRDIPLKKPEDEYRIFLAGGSTAFGLGAIGQSAFIMNNYSLTYRETISHIMEKILNSTLELKGKKVRVYNAAVWGYAYQHGLMRYIAKLARYDPDMVISLDGVNELSLVSNLKDDWSYFQQGQFHSVLKEMYSYNRQGLASYLTLWFKNNTYFMSYMWRGRDLFQVLHQSADTDAQGHWALTPQKELTEKEERKLDENLNEVVRVVENYHSVMESDQTQHIFVMQPWFYSSKKPLNERERQMAAYKEHALYYGIPSARIYEKLVEKVTSSGAEKDFPVMDLTGFFDDVNEWVFTDWCHLTSGANHLIAKAICNKIKRDFFHQELTLYDKIDYKDSYFWNVTAVAKPVYAPAPLEEESGVANILTGYPGQKTYTSAKTRDDEPLELVLDLQRTYPVSRLRIVWANKEAVPEEWAVEASMDNENWILITKADKSELDNYSQWPGYEFYGATEVFARYIKYRPIKSRDRVISLRTFAAYR